MPCTFAVSAQSQARVEQIHTAFASTEYWSDRLAVFGGVADLYDLTVDDDGVVTVATAQDLRHLRLPAAAAKLMPGELSLRRREVWRPLSGGQVCGEIEFVVPAGLGSGTATALIVPTSQGSRLTSTVTVAVNLPVFGGQVERYFRSQVAAQLPDMFRFTATWIAEHRADQTERRPSHE